MDCGISYVAADYGSSVFFCSGRRKKQVDQL